MLFNLLLSKSTKRKKNNLQLVRWFTFNKGVKCALEYK